MDNNNNNGKFGYIVPQQVKDQANAISAMEGPPEIPAEEIQFDKTRDLIGEGAFGKVYRAKCRGKDVAVKMPNRQKLSKEELESFRHEVQMMRRIFHPNVVLFLGACSNENCLMFVTELMEGDLEHLIRNPNIKLSFTEKIKLAKDAALGMNWLHGINSIIHRDLKPANLLYDKNRNVKVTDFGFCQFKPRDQLLKDKRGPKGTALYMAPEVMTGRPFDERADVYSFGPILWEILTGKELFEQYEEWDEFQEAICDRNERPEIPADCPPALASLMQKCWAKNPEERPGFKEIVFRLDEILCDCYITGIEDGKQQTEDAFYVDEARLFWKKYFLLPQQALRETIPWKEFSTVLSGAVNLPLSTFEGLKSQLTTPDGENNELTVTIKNFARITQWFGPFFIPEKAKHVLEQMTAIIGKPWFHGFITSDEAERRLSLELNKKPGTFLIRLSTSEPRSPFAISRVGDDNTITHKRIKVLADDKGYSVPVRNAGNKVFQSILDLVEDPEMRLKTPCPVLTKKKTLYESSDD